MKPRWSALIGLSVIVGLWLAPAAALDITAASSQATHIVPASPAQNPLATPTVRPPARPTAPQDIPETIVTSGTVNDFMRVDTTIYWHSVGSCYTPPAGPVTPDNPGDVPESVTRVSTIYASPPRLIYYKDIRASNSCNQYVFSRVVADASNLYWVDTTGLVKLSKNANPGDVPPVLSASFADQRPYQIAIDSQYIYLSRDAYSSCGPIVCFINNARLVKVDKTTGVITGLDCSIVSGCPYAVTMKVDPGERYLYYIDTSSNLQRMDLSNPTSITQLATQVHSYYPEGRQLIGCVISPPGCFYSDYVFIGRGDTAAGQTHEIVRYSNPTDTGTTIYTSNYSLAASINDIVADGSEIFSMKCVLMYAMGARSRLILPGSSVAVTRTPTAWQIFINTWQASTRSVVLTDWTTIKLKCTGLKPG